MKRITTASVLAFFVALLTFSCSDDDNPTGGDPGSSVIPPDTVTQHQLTPGMWWVETRYDTSKTDSGGASYTVREEHHVRNKVLFSLPGDAGAVDYYIEESDTGYSANGAVQGVSTDTIVIRQKGSKLQVLVYDAAMLYGILYPTIYEFPMTVGDSWTVMDDSADTTFRMDASEFGFDVGMPPVKVRMLSRMTGEAQVGGMVTYTFADSVRPCLDISSESDVAVQVLLDTTIVYGQPPLAITFNQGDSLYSVVVTANAQEYFCGDFALALWSREVVVTTEESAYATDAVIDSSTTVRTVTALHDPRWDPADTLYLAP
ncbi:MAG: hypothetical protein GF331_09645 [Chitinivibrionales bacterium]|nr:hypothetical protein [Chitinivibrionales bacterium]